MPHNAVSHIQQQYAAHRSEAPGSRSARTRGGTRFYRETRSGGAPGSRTASGTCPAAAAEPAPRVL